MAEETKQEQVVNNDTPDESVNNREKFFNYENESQIPKEHKHGIETRGMLATSDANDTDGSKVRPTVEPEVRP